MRRLEGSPKLKEIVDPRDKPDSLEPPHNPLDKVQAYPFSNVNFPRHTGEAFDELRRLDQPQVFPIRDDYLDEDGLHNVNQRSSQGIGERMTSDGRQEPQVKIKFTDNGANANGVSEKGSGSTMSIVEGPEPKKAEAIFEKKEKRMSFLKKLISDFRDDKVPTNRDMDQKQYALLRDLHALNAPKKQKSIWHIIKEPFPQGGKFRLLWNSLLVLLIATDAIILPVEISFDSLLNTMSFEYLIFAIYVADIFVHLHTSYQHQTQIVKSHKKIAKIYFQGWFIFDLIAAFPYFAIPALRADAIDNADRLTWGLFRLLRLIKIGRGYHIVNKSKALRRFRVQIYSTHFMIIFKLIKIYFVALYIAHWLGCAWHWLAALELEFFGNNVWMTNKGIIDTSEAFQYATSLYWAAYTLSTVGYGDISPVSMAEYWFAAIAILFGTALFAYIVNGVTAIIDEFTKEQDKLNEQVFKISKFINKNDLSKEISQDMKNYLKYLMEEDNNRKEDMDEYLEIMPESLRKRVFADIYLPLLKNIPAFSINFRDDLLRALTVKMKEKTIGPGEIICPEDCPDAALYVVVKGRAELYFDRTKQTAKVVGVGDFFGEVAFFSDRRNSVCARSDKFSRVFYLEENDMMQVVNDFPDQKETYYQLRDSINVYQDYSMIYSVCLACNREGHPPTNCPFLHYNPDRYHTVKVLLQKQKEFCQSFQRKSTRQRFHALNDLKEIERGIQKLRANHFVVQPASVNSIEVNINNMEDMKQKILQDPNLPQCLTLLSGNHSNIIEELFQHIDNQSKLLQEKDRKSQRKIKKIQNQKNHQQKDDFEFDRVMIYTRYFVHNNVDRVIKKINSKLNHSKPFQTFLTNLEGSYIFNPQNYI